jgi:hypothetical protein
MKSTSFELRLILRVYFKEGHSPGWQRDVVYLGLTAIGIMSNRLEKLTQNPELYRLSLALYCTAVSWEPK